VIPLAVLAIVNGVLTVPPSHWKAIDLGSPTGGTQLQIEFTVRSGSRVQALLLTRTAAERFHRGRSFEPICSSGFQSDIRMRCRVPEQGSYVLIVDNRIEARPATLHLRVHLQTPPDVIVRELPPQRRQAVVALSIAFFGAVLLFSARQFLKHQ
jgi:hypothetical protein